MYNVLAAMIQDVQKLVLQEADRSTRTFGKLYSQNEEFHHRCVPKHVRKSLDLDIAATQYREQRNALQKKKKVSRDEAAQIMVKQQLSDLDVWRECIPEEKEIAPTARAARARTRQITARLQRTNKETEGYKS